MKKIPTAEEFLIEAGFTGHAKHGLAKKWMIEFAQLHVEAALKEASINAETEEECGNPYDPEDRYYVVNKDSILNSYPLDKIK